MKKIKPYVWKPPKEAALPRNLNRSVGINDAEMLVGEIQGMRASDLEERFARALDKAGLEYEFRAPFIAGRNLPGEIEVDFLVQDGAPQPIQIDGAFTHKSAEQREEDAVKDAILNAHLSGWALPVIRLPDTRLDNQAEANLLVEELF